MNHAFDSSQQDQHKARHQAALDTSACPHCQTSYEEDVPFCVECGQIKTVPCQHCQHPNPAGADICEGCGQWLLAGQCRFCYTPFEEGQTFCEDCGNPPTGIVCSSCQQLSHFDFCKQCQIPLTAQAQEALVALQQNPDLNTLLQSWEEEEEEEETVSSPSPEVAPSPEEVPDPTPPPTIKGPPKAKKLQFGKAKRSTPSPVSRSKPKTSASPKPQSRAAVPPPRSKRKKKPRQNIQAKLDALTQKKTFGNKQEARRFFSALQVVIEKKRTVIRGWRCNLSNTVHPQPNDCARPDMGGQFVTDEIIDKTQFDI